MHPLRLRAVPRLAFASRLVDVGSLEFSIDCRPFFRSQVN